MSSLGTNTVQSQVFGIGVWSGLQANEGSVGYRLVINSEGDIQLYKTTDSGENWTLERTL